MKETEWAESVALRLDSYLKNISSKLAADTAQKLCYANEVIQYDGSDAVCNITKFETDILVYEYVNDDSWKPRVVIETKVRSVTTHDAITYSKKAENHRFVHPYLRYGIFVGCIGNSGIPARLVRHGDGFDFMLSTKDYEMSDNEWLIFSEVISSEIESSKLLEATLYNNRSKTRNHYMGFHRPLVEKA